MRNFRCTLAPAMLFVGALAACQSNVPPSIAPEVVKAEPPEPPADAALLEAWSTESSSNYEEHEKRALAGAPARRKGETLILSLTNGRERRYKSVTTNCELDDEKHCYYYYLVAYLSRQGSFLVSYAHFEDQYYKIVDAATGTAVDIPAFPLFSPSGMNLATDEEAYESILQIWRKTAHGWVNEFRLRPEDPGGDLHAYWKIHGWRNDDALEVEEITKGRNTSEERSILTTLARTEKGWAFDPPR